MSKRGVKRDTQLVTLGRDRAASFDGVNPPLVRASTILHDSVADMHARIGHQAEGNDRPPNTYGIYGSATHHAFYDALSELEGGHRSCAFPSGLNAIALALLAYVGQGDHVLMTDSVYGPGRRFCRDTLPQWGVTTTFYDPCIGDEIERLFTPTTRVLYLESPGSLTFEMQDVPRLAAIARRHRAVTILDNSWATPLYFQPIVHGVDVSLHAATKYICGHSDVMMGTVTCNEASWPAMRKTIHHFGVTTSADDCYSALRGLRTLGARLKQHRATAEALIAWLKQQPEVERVLYPADPGDPGHALWQRDMSGASGLFGIALKPGIQLAPLHAFVDGMQLFGRGYSWGGYESLLIPSYPPRTATSLPFAGHLVRIAAGLENPDDLIADLDAGFTRLRGGAGR